MGYVLVTGSNGFIGSKLVDAMLNKGYKVLGISTSDSIKKGSENYKHIKMNITHPLSVESLFDTYDIEAVIHLAAIAHLKNRKKISWNEFYRVNALASKCLFEAAINSGANIFFASTVDVYGDKQSKYITEESKPEPISDYAHSKQLAEQTLIEKANLHSTNCTIARFAPVYDKGYMKDAYKRIYISHPNIAFRVGKGKDYHFVSVNNVIDFILKWLSSREEISGIYNVVDSEYINTIDFIELEKQIGNVKKVFYIPNQLFSIIKPLLKLINLIINNEKVSKISLNIHKLTNPPRYSLKRMSSILSPKWNLENTVYNEQK
ncbi:NAD(P)-dependent oxidoreductase [Lentibacillus sp. CBA3610]|uniref:NAD-dependent epimerase/dehydratase family protein n=1 Tax=Lentibacillus sp. CBA3610 TaxID=2518176 RepID=UPI001595A2EA|nr:NAD(P)-dependent oxidoreductase [Lentibacillus sp. CBA3610]